MRLGRLLVAAITVAAGVTACGVPGQAPSAPGSGPAAASPTPSPPPAATGASTVYVAGYRSDTVTPIDTATNTAGPAIRVGPQPIAIAVTPNGRTAYVVNQNASVAGPDISDGTVTPITTATNTPGNPIKVGRLPAAIAITPDGQTAYVVNQGDNTVTPIATATNTPGKPIKVGMLPTAIAITPDGQTAYVASMGIGDGSVTPISTATNEPGKPVSVGYDPKAIVVTPDGQTAYVVNSGGYTGTSSGQIHLAGTVTPISTATDRPGATITIGGNPTLVAMAITPDGQTAYVLADAPAKGSLPLPEGAGFVVPVATATNQPGKPIAVGQLPSGLAITPDGATLYVSDSNSNTVTPIAIAANVAGHPISTGNAGPAAVLVAPGGRTVYAVGATGDVETGSVIPIAVATGQAGNPVSAGVQPMAIAITTNGHTPYTEATAVSTVLPNFVSASVSTVPPSSAVPQLCKELQTLAPQASPQPCPSSVLP
jgi:YVTN family beta-propeller protein